MSRVSRTAAVAFAAFAAFSALATPPAQADPGICIDFVMEQGYEPTDQVLLACKIGKTGHPADARKCRRILVDDGVRPPVATHACRLASRPEQEPS